MGVQMDSNTNPRLKRRMMAEIDRHADHHEAARTAINLAILCALRSVGPVQTADFLRDAADYLEHETIQAVMQ